MVHQHFRHLLIPVAIVVVVTVVLSVAAVGCSGYSDTHVAFGVGSVGKFHSNSMDGKVTVNAVTDPADFSSNEFEELPPRWRKPPRAGNHFLTIAITIENTGDREMSMLWAILRTADGFNSEFVNGFGTPDVTRGGLQYLKPGEKAGTLLAFEVKDGSEIEWLKLEFSIIGIPAVYFDN